MWHEIFAGSNFCDFSSDPFLHIKTTAKLTPELKISANLSTLHKNSVLRNRVCWITTCLFHLEQSTMNNWFDIELAYRSVV